MKPTRDRYRLSLTKRRKLSHNNLRDERISPLKQTKLQVIVDLTRSAVDDDTVVCTGSEQPNVIDLTAEEETRVVEGDITERAKELENNPEICCKLEISSQMSCNIAQESVQENCDKLLNVSNLEHIEGMEETSTVKEEDLQKEQERNCEQKNVDVVPKEVQKSVWIHATLVGLQVNENCVDSVVVSVESSLQIKIIWKDLIGFLTIETSRALIPHLSDGSAFIDEIEDIFQESATQKKKKWRSVKVCLKLCSVNESILAFVSERIEEDTAFNNRRVDLFCGVVSATLERFSHLFSEQDMELLSFVQNRRLSKFALRLLSRIVFRTHCWQDSIRFLYDELKEAKMSKVLEELVASGLIYNADSFIREVDTSSASDLQTLLSCLTVEKLKDMCAKLAIRKVNLVKSGIVDKLVRFLLFQKSATGVVMLQMKPVSKILHDSLAGFILLNSQFSRCVDWIFRLYSLDFMSLSTPKPEQYGKLGYVKFKNYKISSMCGCFESMDLFSSFMHSVQLYQRMLSHIEKGEDEFVVQCIKTASEQLKEMAQFISANLPPFYAGFTVEGILIQICHEGSKILEDLKQHGMVAEVYKLLISLCSQNPSLSRWCSKRRGHWWERLSLITERYMKKPEDAYQLTLKALQEDKTCLKGASFVNLLSRAQRLWKSKPRGGCNPVTKYSDSRGNHASKSLSYAQVAIQCRPLNRETGVKSLFYDLDNDLCSVEDIALEHYQQNGWKGVHCEGSIWHTLFGLIMWDIIWIEIPGVFITPFQSCPLDFRTECFYEARKTQIDSFLSEIGSGACDLVDLLKSRFSSQFGVSCVGVRWDSWSLDDLITVVECFGCGFVSAVLGIISKDAACYFGGMPDLTIWKTTPKVEGKLVEVKGPRDRLQANQEAWIFELQRAGYLHCFELCNVEETLTPRKRKGRF
jgi:Fanconi-associated nuclease 1